MKGYLIKDNYFQNFSFTFTLFKQIILEVQPLLMPLCLAIFAFSIYYSFIIIVHFFPGYLFEYHITGPIMPGNLIVITDNIGYQGHKHILC